MKPKIYISVCGGGLGHSSRMVALANHLKENYDIIFGSSGKSLKFIESHGFKVYDVHDEITLAGSEKGKVSIVKTLSNFKELPISWIKVIKEEIQLIRKYDFDIIISDFYFPTIIAAKLMKKNIIFVTNANVIDVGYKPLEKYSKKLSKSFFNNLFKLIDYIVIPDFPIPYTISLYNLEIEDNLKVSFVGPMIRYDPSKYKITKEIIFCTFGGEKYKLPLYCKLKEIAEENPEHHFVVACGLEEVKNLKSENFEVYSYIKDVDQYLCRTKATILHGGLSSIHETLCFGKAPLLLYDPNHSEQRNNAYRVKELGAGEIVSINELDKIEINEKLKKVINIDNSFFYKKYLSLKPFEKFEKIILEFL